VQFYAVAWLIRASLVFVLLTEVRDVEKIKNGKESVSITKIGYPEDRYGNLDKRLQALSIKKALL